MAKRPSDSFDLHGAELVNSINGAGGLLQAMGGRIHCDHIRDPKLRAIWKQFWQLSHEAQAIIAKQDKAAAERMRLGFT